LPCLGITWGGVVGGRDHRKAGQLRVLGSPPALRTKKPRGPAVTCITYNAHRMTQSLWEVFREASEVWLLDNCGNISGWKCDWPLSD
jgi:hypothetical protein